MRARISLVVAAIILSFSAPAVAVASPTSAALPAVHPPAAAAPAADEAHGIGNAMCKLFPWFCT